MSRDNSLGAGLDVKREGVDPPQSNCCRGSGEPMSTHIPAPAQACGPSRPSFQPRPFPPPSLEGVPIEYIVDQLRNLASHYWNKPETADCTIIVPVPYARGKPLCSLPPFFPQSYTSLAGMYDRPSGLGRRATAPALNFVPRVSLKLHIDYLSTHSSYIRALFSGASPLDLINAGLSSSGRFKIPENRRPRLMSSSSNHPVLFLPVPDPASFHLLVHWIYFGNTHHIEDCLHQGTIQWEGIARNVEYLGLSTEIKVFLGRWYSRWLHPEQAEEHLGDDDSDTVYSDYDDVDYDSSTASVMDDSDVELGDEKDISRGRSRVTRPLSYQDPRTRTFIA